MHIHKVVPTVDLTSLKKTPLSPLVALFKSKPIREWIIDSQQDLKIYPAHT